MEKSARRELLPKSVRQHIYSFLPLDVLIKVISKLSKSDRELLLTSELIDQPRALRIKFKDNLIYDTESLKFMMKLLKNKWDRPHNQLLNSSTKGRKMSNRLSQTSNKLTKQRSSSPVLEDNFMNRLLDINSDVNENQIFREDFNEISISDNESELIQTQPAANEEEGMSRNKSIQQSVAMSDHKMYVKQKRADVQLQIECENPAMIPFVRYVLQKA